MMAQQQAGYVPATGYQAASPTEVELDEKGEAMSATFHIMSNSFFITPAQYYLAIQYCRAVDSMKP
jgi:hypothetical protein